MAKLTGQQQRVRDAFLRESARRSASPKKVKALLEAGLVEANLGNPNYGDRDSIGSLQERSHYGSAKRRLNPVLAARRFLKEAEQLDRPDYSAGELAQAVQRSAFPGRYDARGSEADALIGGRVSGRAGGRPASMTKRTIPGVDRSAERDALVSSYFARSYDKGALINLAMGMKETKDTPARKVTIGSSAPKATAASRSSGRFKVTGPDPSRLQPSLVGFAKKVAGVYGAPITGSDGSGHSRLTVNGRVSQHSTGNATDIPASGKTLLRMGRAALIAAGMPRAKALKAPGGLYNLNGHQIIFGVNGRQYGGDHTDHLHIST